jgi:hypothetical protein
MGLCFNLWLRGCAAFFSLWLRECTRMEWNDTQKALAPLCVALAWTEAMRPCVAPLHACSRRARSRRAGLCVGAAAARLDAPMHAREFLPCVFAPFDLALSVSGFRFRGEGSGSVCVAGRDSARGMGSAFGFKDSQACNRGSGSVRDGRKGHQRVCAPVHELDA